MFNYEAILSDYYNTQISLDSFLYDISIEEQVTTQPMNSGVVTGVSEKDRKWTERIRSLIGRIIAVIEEKLKELLNGFKTLMHTSKSFDNAYREAKRRNLPLKGLKLIMYNYNDLSLDTKYEKFSNLAKKITKTSSSESPLSMEKDQFEKYIYREILGKEPEAGYTMANLLRDAKLEYRGEKKEQIVSVNIVTICEKKIQMFRPLENVVNSDLNDLLREAKRIRSEGVNYKVNTNASPSVSDGNTPKQKTDPKIVGNITFLYNSFATFAHWYTNLKFEQVFQCRAILKRFYQF